MLNFFAGGSGGMHTLAYPLMKNILFQLNHHMQRQKFQQIN